MVTGGLKEYFLYTVLFSLVFLFLFRISLEQNVYAGVSYPFPNLFTSMPTITITSNDTVF